MTVVSRLIYIQDDAGIELELLQVPSPRIHVGSREGFDSSEHFSEHTHDWTSSSNSPTAPSDAASLQH